MGLHPWLHYVARRPFAMLITSPYCLSLMVEATLASSSHSSLYELRLTKAGAVIRMLT